MRILIVEDLEVSRKLLRLTLQAEGYSVIEAADGLEALTKLKSETVDVIVSDILMPNMDGYHLLSEIRQDSRLKALPVIMYSSTYNSPTDKKLSMEMGANAFLSKPSPVDVLKETIHRVTAEKGGASISSFGLTSTDVIKPYNQRLVQLLEDRNEKLITRTAELEESEGKFRQFAENIQDVLWITNADQTEMVYVSPAYEQIWGRTCQSLYNKPSSWMESIHPEDRQSIESSNRSHKQSRDAVEYEYRIIRPDGSIRWIYVKSFPVKNALGVVHRVAGIASDVTERKTKEVQLEEAAELSALAADVGVALTQGDSLRSMLYECTAAVVTHLDAAFARIWTHNEETDTLELQASAGMYTHLDGPHGRVPVGKFKIGKIAAERKPHLTNAVQGDPLVPEQEWARREGLISFAGYPLVVDQKPMGVIAMFARHTLTDAALNAMAAIANGIALGIQRKQAETEIRRQHEELQFILDAVPALVFYKDREGRFVRVNRELARIVGAPPEAFVGKTDMEMDSLNGERYRQDDLRVMASGQPLRHVEEPLHTAGGIRWLLTDKVPHRDESGRIIGVIGFAVDITERKHAEERVSWLASFPERNPNPILELDMASGLVNYANPAAVRAFPELQNQGFAHPSLVGLREAGQTLIDKTTGVVIREILVGKDSYMQTINYIPETNRLRVYWSDITARKQILEALRKSEDQLRQAQKMDAIGQLAGGVAHDFNNQLNAIMGYAGLLVDQLSDPKLKRFADNILTSTQRSADLTQKLLAFSRKGQFQAVPLSVHKLVVETVQMLERSIDKRIEIKQSLKAESDIVVGDPSQMQNAFLNLAVNARDAMPGGGELHFQTENVFLDAESMTGHVGEAVPGHYVRISLTDTGTGMSDEVKRHLFEPFFTTKPVGKGTGMGLASVFGTVKNHNGLINVYSEVAHGTTFTLYLPLAEQTSTTVAAGAVAVAKPTQALRILLVEDEDILREMFSYMLTSGGHTIVEAENGRQALELYCREWKSIDLVILDMIMPEMNGPDTFREMKKINPQIKSLLSTGFSLNTEVQAILDEGVRGFIQKPFMRNDLLALISKVMLQ